MPYLNVVETNTKLEFLSHRYSSLCELIELPEVTEEGRTSWALKVHAGTLTPRPRHGILLVGGVHAREWGSTDILIYFLESLLLAYVNGMDLVFGAKTFSAQEVKDALESVELFCFPVVNPDGKEYSFQPGDMDPAEYPWNSRSKNRWRKNRRPNAGTVCRGVDINRNYEFLWDFRKHFHPDSIFYESANYCYWKINVSDAPCGETYHGPEETGAFSERETRNVRSLLDSNPRIRFFVDVHGVKGVFLYPWGDDEIQTTDPEMNFTNQTYDGLRGLSDWVDPGGGCIDTSPHPDGPAYKEYMHAIDKNRYDAIGYEMRDALRAVRGRTYNVGPGYSLLYGISGSSKDYVFGRHLADRTLSKVDAFLIEWGQREEWSEYYLFQPPYEDPPGLDKMTPVILDVSASLMALCATARRVPIVSVSPSLLDFGTVRVGTAKILTMQVRNNGSERVEITGIALEGLAPPAQFAVGTPGPLILESGQSQTISVTFAPSDRLEIAGDLSVAFRKVNETIHDVRLVRLLGLGCTVPEGACVAPVFEAGNWLICLLLAISAPFVIAGFIVLLPIIALIDLFIPGTLAKFLCRLRQFIFRVKNCGKGNDDPCLTRF